MVFEGIVVHKVPYKERDLIVKLLLRRGAVASFYVYGGQGGGKHHKPDLFDLGAMMRIQIRDRKTLRTDVSELMVTQEVQRIWNPTQLRYDVRAFYLLCLYFELVQKMAITYHPEESGEEAEQEGMFSVVSNALYYLNESLVKKDFAPEQHLSLFLVKLLFYLGIMPEAQVCGFCGGALSDTPRMSFVSNSGHFGCAQCMAGEDDRGLWLRIRQCYQTKFQDYAQVESANFGEADKLIHYFCYHFHLRPVELRSYSLLFR